MKKNMVKLFVAIAVGVPINFFAAMERSLEKSLSNVRWLEDKIRDDENQLILMQKKLSPEGAQKLQELKKRVANLKETLMQLCDGNRREHE